MKILCVLQNSLLAEFATKYYMFLPVVYTSFVAYDVRKGIPYIAGTG